MTPEQYERIRGLFLAAREEDPSQRATFLEQACDDAQVRAEVESLLASDEKADTFLQTPALGVTFEVGDPADLLGSGAHPTSPGAPASPALGDLPQRIGQYRILDRLGEGGMGVVYRAEQENPRRTVALKVIKPGMRSREALRRFEHEGQVLAWLQHPGIAQIFEAGTADTGQGPQPFFAMELVQGQPLLDYVHIRKLALRARLELLAKICDAVEHAHQKGVVHRDLKPANILVDATGQPKILDFGVARVTDADIRTSTLQTAVGQLVGTIAYMSPEQVAGDPSALDTRSDVYSLGVITYELLTGQIPVDVSDKTIPQAARAIVEEEPPSLRSINRALGGDIDTIVAKALEKEKERRYKSASDLAADIRHYLADQPITARPVTTMYQLRKFAQRNRVLVAGLAGIALALLAGTVVSTALAFRAREAEERAEQRLVQVEEALSRATTETARAQAFKDFLVRMLGQVDPDVAMGRDTALLQAVLDQAADDIESELVAYPAVQASIHQVIGTVYRNISRYDEAEQHLQAAYDLSARHVGENSAAALAALDGLAELRWQQGRFPEAQALFEQLVARYGAALGENGRETLRARYSLAGVLKDSGQLDAAEQELRETLAAMRSHLSEHDDAVLDAMNGLAALAIKRGQIHAETEELLRTVVQHWTDRHGPRHPRRIRALRNLAVVVKERGDLAEGEELSRESLDLHREVFGEDHHDTIRARINLTGLLRERGALEEAEGLARRALEQAQSELGAEHPDTLKAVSHLGVILREAGRLDEAQPYLQRAVDLSEKLHGRNDPRTLNRLSSLAGVFYERQEFAKAEHIMRQVVAGLREVFGERSFHSLSAMNNFGLLLMERDKLAEAEEILLATIEGADAAAPPGHWFRWTVRGTYGQCLTRMNRFEEAEALLRECYDGLAETLGREHNRTRGIAAKLVALYEVWGRPDEATEYRALLDAPPERAPATTAPAATSRRAQDSLP